MSLCLDCKRESPSMGKLEPLIQYIQERIGPLRLIVYVLKSPRDGKVHPIQNIALVSDDVLRSASAEVFLG